MVRVLAVEKGGVLQEHGSRLQDKGGEQLGVDVVPGAAEPPGVGRERGFWCAYRGRGKTEQGRTEWTWIDLNWIGLPLRLWF